MAMKRLFSLNPQSKAKLSKEMFALIGTKRGITLLVFLGLLPSILLVYQGYTEFQELREKREMVSDLHVKMQKWTLSQRQKQAYLEKYKQADPHYLDHVIEPLAFLETEISQLKLIKKHPSFSSCEDIDKRLSYLSNENHCFFHEEDSQKGSFFLETRYVQRSEIEITLDDLKKVLSYTEGVALAPHSPPSIRPQLFIHQLSLKWPTDHRGIFKTQFNVTGRVICE